MLYDRSRYSAEEQRKLLISLGTGTIAIFFLALTAKIEPSLTVLQKTTIGIGLFFIALSVLSGIFQWFADAKWNYAWARSLESKSSKDRKKRRKSKDQWHKIQRVTGICLRANFVIGILSAVFYVFARVWSI